MGNLSGDLTLNRIPYAIAAHTLADSPLSRDGADGVKVDGAYRSEGLAVNPWTKKSAGVGSLAQGPDFIFNRSKGTNAAPVVLNDGDSIGGFSYSGYDGTGFSWGHYTEVVVDGTPSAGITPMGCKIWVRDQEGDDHNSIFIRAYGFVEFRGVMEFHNATLKKYLTLLTTAGLVEVDADLSDFFRVSVDVNIALVNPTHPREGRVIQYRFTQTAGGGHTISFDTKFRFPDGISPPLSVDDGAVDYMAFQYNEADDKWDFAGGAPNLLVPS